MLQLVINFDETTGAINVTGPIENKMLVYGMLGMAHDIVAAYQPADKPKLAVVRDLPVHLNGGGWD